MFIPGNDGNRTASTAELLTDIAAGLDETSNHVPGSLNAETSLLLVNDDGPHEDFHRPVEALIDHVPSPIMRALRQKCEQESQRLGKGTHDRDLLASIAVLENRRSEDTGLN